MLKIFTHVEPLVNSLSFQVYTSVYSPVAPLTPYDRRQADYSSIVNIWVPGSGMVPALSSEDNIFSNTEKSPC